MPQKSADTESKGDNHMAKKKIVLAQPKLNSEGKKEWGSLYSKMDDKTLIKHAGGVLHNMPMTFLELLGDEILKRNK